MSSTVSNFKRKRGISLEMLQWKRASSRDDGRTLWFFSSCFGILDLRRGTQDASRVCPGKSNLHSCCEGELGITLESLQGKWTSSRLVSRNSVFVSSYNRELGVEFKVHMRSQSSSRVQRTPLSSRVVTGISWSPLSVLNGVKPPVELGERTRDCSLCPSGKEGPHVAMTAESRVFF